jgi:hypothetical protein
MTCPKCGQEMTDFRAQKASGAKPPKFPDFKCEACQVPKWITPKPKPTAAPSPGPTPLARGPKHTWAGLSQMYYQSLLIARKQVIGVATAAKLEYTIADILSAAATIFIAASRDGVKQPEPEPEPETADAY